MTRNQPATYPRAFVEAAEHRGVSRADVLARAGLPAEALDDPAARVSMVEMLRTIQAVFELAGDPLLGFEAGRRLPLTAHGSLGYALMCAQTPREAIGILERFWHLRGRGVLMATHVSGDGLFFEVTPELPLPPALCSFMFSSLLTSMHQGIRFLIPGLASSTEIWLEGEAPDDFAARLDDCPGVRFGMPRAGIALRGDLSQLDDPLPTANPEALTQAIAQCERESALLGEASDVLRRTRAALVLGHDGYPGPDRLAALLDMAPRTFRRRLQEQGQSYQRLLEEARRRDACRLLAEGELSVQRIGELLGYTDPANFTRAFRNWTGMTPTRWRARHGFRADVP